MGQKTASSEEAELVQVFTSWEVSHLPHSATEWLEEVYSLPMFQCSVTCKMDHGDILEQTSLSEKKERQMGRCRISLILFTAKTSLSSSSKSGVSTTTGNKNLQLGNEKKVDNYMAGRKK